MKIRAERSPLLLAATLIAVCLAVPSSAVTGAGAARQDGGPLFYPDDPVWNDPDRDDIPKPRARDLNEIVQAMKASVSGPRIVERYALNVNTLGQVPDSAWFTNRHGLRDHTLGELAKGPDRKEQPVSGPWRVIDLPGEGRTPKLMIEDPDGSRYILKFENEDNPRLQSATEVVCTRFFHAFGYHVPDNRIVVFDPERLFIDPDVKPEEFPAHDLEEMLEDVPRTPDGRVRALASALLEGEPLGPFTYEGTRPDDANDVFPHQHRRELRGLKVFAAWLHHTDTKANNSLDTYVEENGSSYVRHHLIDFGSCMGSGATGPKERTTGYERYVDGGGILKGIASFGLWSPASERVDYPAYPAVGTFEADFYEPWRWKPPLPNAAFQHMDAADAFWAARIVARFSDEDVMALVSTGRYGDPEAKRYVRETLIQRRDETVSYWLTRTNPLDRFRIEDGSDGPSLSWDNAAVRHGVAGPEATYEVRWLALDNESGDRRSIAGAERDPEASRPLPADPWGPEDRFGLRYAVAEVSTRHPDFPHWDRPVTVTLRRDGGEIRVVGVRRPREMPETDRGRTSGQQQEQITSADDPTR